MEINLNQTEAKIYRIKGRLKYQIHLIDRHIESGEGDRRQWWADEVIKKALSIVVEAIESEFPDNRYIIKPSITAAKLVKEHGKSLIGKLVLTPALGSYPGGLATVIEVSPDTNCSEIAFIILLPEYGECGVFSDELVELNYELN